uniref:Protein kinase domain-containing protein n=1 Tax=Cyprinodon variegatus TaxID=28743 RepID=A0A3Q2G5H5_CYPVA
MWRGKKIINNIYIDFRAAFRAACEPNDFGLESGKGKYCLLYNLGHGGTADVFEGRNQETGEIVAIKTSNEEWDCLINEEKRVFRKIKALGSDYYNIVKFYEHFYYETTQYLVFEKLDIDLDSFTVHVGGGLHLSDIRVIAKQVLVALNFLHRNGIAHRDLKPNNIMLVERSSLKVKLIDMGFAQEIKTMRNIRCNPLTYMPPEEILLIKPDASVDMWSIVKMLGEPHFSSKCVSSFKKKSRTYDPKLKLKSLDDLLKIRPPTQDPTEREDLLSFIDLLKQMLVPTPQERITSAAALKHSFITMDHLSYFNTDTFYVLEAYEAMICHRSLTAESLGLKLLYSDGISSFSDEVWTDSPATQSPSPHTYSVISGDCDPPTGNSFHAKTEKVPESLPVSFDDPSHLVKVKTKRNFWSRIRKFFSDLNCCCLRSPKSSVTGN